MNPTTDKRFYFDFANIRSIYPGDISRKLSHLGVLEPYRDQKYTLHEINAIIAEWVVKTPYIPHSMQIKVAAMGIGYHHLLVFNNYDYRTQTQVDDPHLSFLYDSEAEGRKEHAQKLQPEAE